MEVVQVVHRRDPRAVRRAYHRAGGGPRVGGPCGPTWATGPRADRLPSGPVLESPGVVSGLDDLAVVRQAIQERGGHLGVAEHGRVRGGPAWLAPRGSKTAARPHRMALYDSHMSQDSHLPLSSPSLLAGQRCDSVTLCGRYRACPPCLCPLVLQEPTLPARLRLPLMTLSPQRRPSREYRLSGQSGRRQQRASEPMTTMIGQNIGRNATTSPIKTARPTVPWPPSDRRCRTPR